MNDPWRCVVYVYIDGRRVYPEKAAFIRRGCSAGYILVADGNKKGYGFTGYEYIPPEAFRTNDGNVYFGRASVALDWNSRISVDQELIDSLWCDDG